MVVAVSLVGMMKMSLHEIVLMTTVRNRFMPAASSMRVLAVVRAARMSGSTSGRIRATLRQGVFIHVPLVGAVKMPVMHIVNVTFVLNRDMPAAWTVSMSVLIMRSVIAHRSCLLPISMFDKIFGRRAKSVKR
jgi:uncharacterized protein YqgC (DUF456 family)